jgi:hypothetical protein
MWTSDKLEDNGAGRDEALLRAVPADSLRILAVTGGDSRLGARLKEIDARRSVLGIISDPAAPAQAGEALDQVFTLDIQQHDPPIEPRTLDCILYADVLERVSAPQEVLARHRRLLHPRGIVLCCLPNLQHHALLAALLRGDSPYLPGTGHRHHFTYATFFKVLLDAGFAPEIAATIPRACSKDFLEAAAPLLRHVGVDAGRLHRYLSAHQHIFRGTPLPYHGGPSAEQPLSFVACVSDEEILQSNLLSSPCLAQGSPHELLLMRGCRSAAEGLNRGLARARHALIVFVHQDVYLPAGWPARFWQQYRRAQELYGKIGVLGVYGVSCRNGCVIKTGKVVDRDHLLQEGNEFPAPVDTLDELLLALPRETDLQFAPQLGFHFYGADICLAAKARGLAAVAVDALCFHNSAHAGLPPEFFASAQIFAARWSEQWPLATSCARVDEHGRIHTS